MTGTQPKARKVLVAVSAKIHREWLRVYEMTNELTAEDRNALLHALNEAALTASRLAGCYSA